MKRNKIFSLSLMLEGIKQTKFIGIFLAIFSLSPSCGNPLLRLMSYNSMNYDTMTAQPDFIISFEGFLLPILTVQYLVPIVMIYVLFDFMNKRKALDFYHSIPLSRSCVYLTYTAVALMWNLVIILASTFLSYTIYSCCPKTVISSDFIWPTIISSFILAMLVSSIILVAKGLSGTTFSNIIISIIIMFLPRITILLFTMSVNSAVQIADVSFMSFADIKNNIIFAPFIYSHTNEGAVWLINNAGTLWYSAILAIIYFALGFVLHRFRKSETAGKSSSYKAVQIVVRTLLGAIPLLLISVCFASRGDVIPEFWVIGIASSLLIYFLYEIITTKSAKKLLVAIPFYAISVAINVIFVLACFVTVQSVINDIPQISDISSVSIEDNVDMYINNGDNYYQYKFQDIKFDDKELIKILHSSLVDSVQKVKENKRLSANNDYTEEYTVVYHCKSGRDIKRTVYVNNIKYSDNKETSAVMSLLKKNQVYLDALTSLPTDKEVRTIVTDLDDVMEITQDGKSDVWEMYKIEYNAASIENKCSLNGQSSPFDFSEAIPAITVYGYIGVDNFTQHYWIIPEITPKTFSKLINSYMGSLIEDDIVNKISKSINGDYFMLNFVDMKNPDNYFDMQYYNGTKDKDLMKPYVYGALERYSLHNEIDTKYIPELIKIANIIVDSISDNVDINNGNLIKCSVSSDAEVEYIYDDDMVSYSNNEASKVIYINITDEQYDEINSILKKVCNHTKYNNFES